MRIWKSSAPIFSLIIDLFQGRAVVIKSQSTELPVVTRTTEEEAREPAVHRPRKPQGETEQRVAGEKGDAHVGVAGCRSQRDASVHSRPEPVEKRQQVRKQAEGGCCWRVPESAPEFGLIRYGWQRPAETNDLYIREESQRSGLAGSGGFGDRKIHHSQQRACSFAFSPSG